MKTKTGSELKISMKLCRITAVGKEGIAGAVVVALAVLLTAVIMSSAGLAGLAV